MNVDMPFMANHRFHTYTQRVLARTHLIIERFGARLAGSDSCRKSAKYIYHQFRKVGGIVRVEHFHTRPEAFMGFYQIHVGIYIASLVFLFFNMPLPAAIGLLFIVISAFLEFGFYLEFFDIFYPLKGCMNVISHLEPRDEVKQQVILGAHHDSAFEFQFLRRFQKLYAIRVLAPDIFYAVGIILAWIWVFYSGHSGAIPSYANFLKWFLFAGLLFVLPIFFMVSRRGTPGAGDNLVASSMLVELCHMFGQKGMPGKSWLKHTRLVFTSFDAEESGLRGSRAFTRQHWNELKSIPTYMLNIDSIYNVKDLQFLISDINGSTRLSRELAEECQSIASEAGYQTRLTPMPFGGGGTDAAELAKAGVHATTIIAMPTNAFREGLAYHTMNDTVDAIEPEAVQACLKVAYGFIVQKDQQAGR